MTIIMRRILPDTSSFPRYSSFPQCCLFGGRKRACSSSVPLVVQWVEEANDIKVSTKKKRKNDLPHGSENPLMRYGCLLSHRHSSNLKPKEHGFESPSAEDQVLGAINPSNNRQTSGHNQEHFAKLVDDTTRATDAARYIKKGQFLVYRAGSDYHNARQLLTALKPRVMVQRKKSTRNNATANPSVRSERGNVARLWQKQRDWTRKQTQLLNLLLLQVIWTTNGGEKDMTLHLPYRRAPTGLGRILQQSLPFRDKEKAELIIGEAQSNNDSINENIHDNNSSSSSSSSKKYEGEETTGTLLVPLREVLGMVGAQQWREKGIWIPEANSEDKPAGNSSIASHRPNNNHNDSHADDCTKTSDKGFYIHPHYGVFAPTRREYVDLFRQSPLQNHPPAPPLCKNSNETCSLLDVGAGTGVLTALLLRQYGTHRFSRLVLTDSNPQALTCARDNLQRLGLMTAEDDPNDKDPVVQLEQTLGEQMFPQNGRSGHQKFDWIVCNPPWLPGPADSWLDQAVYDSTDFLPTFLSHAEMHLEPKGQVWLAMSDFAVLLGLRPPFEELIQQQQSGYTNKNGKLVIVDQWETKPWHRKAKSAKKDKDDAIQRLRALEVTRLYRLMRAADAQC